MPDFPVLLIDVEPWLHRAVARAATTVVFDEVAHTEVDLRVARGYLRERLQEVKARFQAKTVRLALGDRTRNFRKELDPGYKSARAGVRLPGHAALEATLRSVAKVITLPGLEADDCLGLMLTKEPTGGRLCVSVDKDMMGVPGWHYDPDKELLREVTREQADHHHLLQTLTGDRVDGYPGCPGVGPVRAARILASEPTTPWLAVVDAFEAAGRTEADALLQARLAFILRTGYYSTKTNEITLWTPNHAL